MIFNMRSLYICVKDMKRAVDFYEELLEMKIAVYDEIYSVFDINGFRFDLFAYEKIAHELPKWKKKFSEADYRKALISITEFMGRVPKIPNKILGIIIFFTFLFIKCLSTFLNRNAFTFVIS